MSALVVKIGGSLWRSPDLARWMEALSAYPGSLTIVPGGGPFADTVRAAQPALGLSDRAAHEMALLAMEQYGIALVDRFAGLALAATPSDAAAAHAAGKIAVWRPRAMVLASDIPASWDVTSDSLAAWYARMTRARGLLLIKSAQGEAPELLDRAFGRFSRGLDVFIAGPADLDAAARALARGEPLGASVSPQATLI